MDWEVSADPERISDLRRRAAARTWTAEKILARIDEEDVDRATVADLLSPPAKWIPELKRIIQDAARPIVPGRLRAGFYLLYLGDPAGTRPFLELLRSADPEEVRQGIHSFSWPDLDLPYDRDALAAAMDPLRAIADDRLRATVGWNFERLRLPGWGPVLRSMLDDPSPEVRARASTCLSNTSESSAETLKSAQAALNKSESDAYHSVLSIGALAGNPGCPVRTDAAKALIDYVRANLGETDHSTGNNIMNASRAIGASGHPEAGKVLREVVGSAQHWSYRATALEELARVEGRRAIDDLERALGDEELQGTAAAEIGYLGRNSGDADLVRRLAKVIGTSKRGAPILRALCFIGGDAARPILREFHSRAGWWESLESEWCLRSLSHREAIYRLLELGVLSEWPASATDAGLLEPDPMGKPPDARAVVIRALKSTRQYISFDLEICTVPVDHDGLIRRFSEISRGVFVPEAIVQTWPANEENPSPDYTVEFLWQGRLHRFTAKYKGDWYDAEAVVLALNRALRLAGRRERFVRLFAGYDQHVEYVFGDAQALLAARRELRLPLHIEFSCPMNEEQIEEWFLKELQLLEGDKKQGPQ